MVPAIGCSAIKDKKPCLSMIVCILEGSFDSCKWFEQGKSTKFVPSFYSWHEHLTFYNGTKINGMIFCGIKFVGNMNVKNGLCSV